MLAVKCDTVVAVLLPGLSTTQVRGEAILQLLDVNWDELAE